MNASTLPEVLKNACSMKNHGITFIEQGDQEDFLSYQDLYRLALQGLQSLQKSGLQPKDELVFQVEDNKAFIILFWSCILGGIIPVPLSVGKNDDQKAKLFNVWHILNKPYLVCSSGHLEKIATFGLSTGQGHLFARIKGKHIDIDLLDEPHEPGTEHMAKPEDLAFIQFSSGSTGKPKGVMLTHENLITNVAAIGTAAVYTTTDSTLSWMPLTHDMGLIGFHINPVFNKMNQYLMPTGLFVRNPTLWLTKATDHKTTVICSPNFGYKYLLKYFDERKDYGWDLSKIRIIYNGAEPISEALSLGFLKTLAHYGLKKKAMCPVYGLAEASLAVSISNLAVEMNSIALDRNQLNVGDQIRRLNSENALSFVNVGTAINDVMLSIADEEGRILKDELIGHVRIRGKNVTAGYYNNSGATKKAISDDGWLDTGDLGFTKKGDLYITGRAKDVFFINGQNFYPHDLERIAEAVDGVELNKIIIVGASKGDAAMEEVIAFVFHRSDVESFLPVIQSLKSRINQETGVELAQVIPVKDIPKTTSGKLQRFKLLERYKARDFDPVIQQIDKALTAYESAGVNHDMLQNETERQLLDLWQTLFDKPDLSVTDRFFEIGGNSLKAAEFAMLVLRHFQVELPLAAIYDQQTVRDLAAMLDSLGKAEYKAIELAPETSGISVSPLQRRLFYFQKANPTSTAYNIPVAFETTAVLDLQQLQNCVDQLLQRYDILRTSFYEEGQQAFMQVHPVGDFTIQEIEADYISQDIFESLIKPFDLKKGNLFNICLLRKVDKESVLFFDFHHIIMDGVSISFFVEELIQSYLGNEQNQPAASYVDFVQWSEAYWASEKLLAHRKFWLNELAGELPVLAMPLDHPRPVQFDHRGEKVAFQISKAKSEKLRELSIRQDCSMHALMFTAYNLLLHKYTGQHELVIGIPVSSRNHPDITRSIGMFVNNLAIRVYINPEDTFQALLQRLMKQVSQTLEQDYPFDLLLDELKIKRDISRNPVFDTMFLYQNMDLPGSAQKTLALTPLALNPKIAKFDISQEVFDQGSGPIVYHIEYASTLFNSESIESLAANFDLLLERILINPETKIANLSLLSVNEYQDQVFRFNDTARTFPGATVIELIETRVLETPEATAITHNGVDLSYTQLSCQSDAVASSLISRGLERGEVVGLYMSRSPELVIAMLGIMKAGGVYLPVDTDLPFKRVDYLLGQSQCRWALTREAQLWQGPEQPEVHMLAIEQLLTESGGEAFSGTIASSDLAYLLYTSGTTGKPKGVKVSHKALHNYISWAANEYVGDDPGCFPLFTPISFDLTLTSIFTPLVTGHSIVIYDDEHSHAVIKALMNNEVDIMKLTPSHLRLLRDVDVAKPGELRLKKMILGGEALTTSLAAEIYEKFKGKVTLYNEYGPTEATVGCMIHAFDPAGQSPVVPIGEPIANTQIYLLDEHLQLVPQGATGEIYVSGEGLASGYWRDEGLSSQKFIPNPFRENEKIYKTGDLARRSPDGLLEYIGRIDEQLKINGYRIEVDEINYHLRQYPGAADSVIEPRVVKGRKQLFAFLLAENESEVLDESGLKSYLAARLPFYMIPTRMVRLEEFPMTGNGKIDREALAKMPIPTETPAPQLPVKDIEKIFASAWQVVLGIDEIAVNDNFFELGGDSIKAVQIVSRLHEKDISVEVKDILTYHTIAQLISNGKFGQTSQSAFQGVVSGAKAMTPIESWFFNQQFANEAYYNQSVLLSINQPLDIPVLQKSFERLIAHHDGLRLNYDSNHSNLFFNERHLEAAFELPVLEIQDNFIGQLTGLKSGFDLFECLLLKAAVFVEKNEQKHLFITAHHLVTDGISWRIFLRDLSEVYISLAEGREPVLPPKTTSLVEWQSQLSVWRPEDEPRSEQYWQQVIKNSFILPLDIADSNWSMSGLQEHIRKLDKGYTDFLIREAHKAYHTDVFTLLNVTLARALHEWTGERLFVIEHENHGRHLEKPDVSRTLGWFTSLYPVLLQLVDEDNSGQIKAIKEQIKQVPDHGISFGLEQQRTDYLKEGKLSEVRFNYLGEFMLEQGGNWSFSGLPTGPESAQENHLTTKLELNAMVMNGQFSLAMSYHHEAFKEKTIQDFGSNFMSHLTRLLDQIKMEGDVHFTPSDFEVSLDQQELDELFM